ncbi:MAG TPA: VOC family protein [Euzebyales bacterium]|nr:VOC family protein [Euzebyales bacterium]
MPGSSHLGAFSISLTVTDLDVSRDFYERLGFEVTGGSADEQYLIMASGTAVIGLFHGMFERNILTFNPGVAVPPDGSPWGPTDDFTDVRDIQSRLQAAGLDLETTTDPDGTGPAHITLVDPDGNPILIDQFFDRPS